MIYSSVFTVVSSNGLIQANAHNGNVLSLELHTDGPEAAPLRRIKQFDVARWNRNNPDTILNGSQVDILTIGYWYRDFDTGAPKYEPTPAEFDTVKPAWRFTDDEEINALNLMKVQGGGFAQRLAEAWLRADMGNRRKLRSQFANFISDYVEQVRAGHGA